METHLPDLQDLRAFCAVVDLHSVSAAAKLLGETKGSVSKRLLRLEKVLGTALLRRSPRLLQVTDEGKAYRARAGRILEALEEARQEVEQVGATPRGRLRITAPVDLASALFAPLIARFLERYPEVTVDMVSTERVLDFDANQLDIALRPGIVLPDSSLIAYPITELSSQFVAAPSYLRAHPAPKIREELRAHRVLVFGPQERLFPDLQPVVRSSEASFVHAMALAGAGIANLPTLLVDEDVRAGRLVPVLGDALLHPKVTLYLLHPAMRFVPAKIRAFRAFLEESLKACHGPSGPRGISPKKRAGK